MLFRARKTPCPSKMMHAFCRQGWHAVARAIWCLQVLGSWGKPAPGASRRTHSRCRGCRHRAWAGQPLSWTPLGPAGTPRLAGPAPCRPPSSCCTGAAKPLAGATLYKSFPETTERFLKSVPLPYDCKQMALDMPSVDCALHQCPDQLLRHASRLLGGECAAQLSPGLGLVALLAQLEARQGGAGLAALPGHVQGNALEGPFRLDDGLCGRAGVVPPA